MISAEGLLGKIGLSKRDQRLVSPEQKEAELLADYLRGKDVAVPREFLSGPDKPTAETDPLANVSIPEEVIPTEIVEGKNPAEVHRDVGEHLENQGNGQILAPTIETGHTITAFEEVLVEFTQTGILPAPVIAGRELFDGAIPADTTLVAVQTNDIIVDLHQLATREVATLPVFE